jgi:Tol biopolymer transport system component
VAREGDKWLVVADGVEGKKYNSIEPLTIMFSPDNQKLAYVALEDNQWHMVVNETEIGTYDYIMSESPVFSPDSQHIAYVASGCSESHEHDATVPHEGMHEFVVLDEEEGKEYGAVVSDSLVFSPDSQRLAYVVQTHSGHVHTTVDTEDTGEETHSHEDDRWCVVVNGEKQKEYRATGDNTIVFSPDSQHIAYAAYDNESWFIVIDGEEQKQYEGISQAVTFSPDSRWLAYIGRTEENSYVVINRNEGKPFTGILIGWGGDLIFDSADKLHYIAINGEEFYLVEETITEAEGK